MRKAAGFCLVLLTLTGCGLLVLHFLAYEAKRTATDAVDLVKSVVNITPEVSIVSSVSHQKTSAIMELASVSKDFPVDYRYQTTLFGSSNEIDLRGEYSVKAGFDLHDRFNVQVDEQTHKVHADFPPPKVLSVQQNRITVVSEKGGLWNWLGPKDRENAVNAMTAEARRQALDLEILPAAKDSLRKQLLDAAHKLGQDWEITFRDEEPPPVPAEAGKH